MFIYPGPQITAEKIQDIASPPPTPPPLTTPPTAAPLVTPPTAVSPDSGINFKPTTSAGPTRESSGVSLWMSKQEKGKHSKRVSQWLLSLIASDGQFKGGS